MGAITDRTFVVGDRVCIVHSANEYGHGFRVGDVCVIQRLHRDEKDQIDYDLRRERDNYWQVCKLEDFEYLERGY